MNISLLYLSETLTFRFMAYFLTFFFYSIIKKFKSDQRHD